MNHDVAEKPRCVELVNPESYAHVQADIVAMLAEILERAKTGEFSSVAVVAMKDHGLGTVRQSVGWRTGELIGLLELAKLDIALEFTSEP